MPSQVQGFNSEGESKWFDGGRMPAGWSIIDPAIEGVESMPSEAPEPSEDGLFDERANNAQVLADFEAQEAKDAQVIADREQEEAVEAQEKADALAKKKAKNKAKGKTS